MLAAGPRISHRRPEPCMQSRALWLHILASNVDLLHGVPMHPLCQHPIWLNRAFRSDLAWWRLFAAEWNGVSFPPPPPPPPNSPPAPCSRVAPLLASYCAGENDREQFLDHYRQPFRLSVPTQLAPVAVVVGATAPRT